MSTVPVPEHIAALPPVLFDGSNTEPDTLQSVVGQAIGAASVCWENMEGTGIFESDRACKILDEVVAWIERNYTLRARPVSESHQPAPTTMIGRTRN